MYGLVERIIKQVNYWDRTFLLKKGSRKKTSLKKEVPSKKGDMEMSFKETKSFKKLTKCWQKLYDKGIVKYKNIPRIYWKFIKKSKNGG